MKEFSLKEPVIWAASFETVMAAYDKRLALGMSALEGLLDLEVVSCETSRNGATTVVEREIQLALDCPEWVKTLIGRKSITLRQRNTIDREARTLETEAWNTTLEDNVEATETCKFYAVCQAQQTSNRRMTLSVLMACFPIISISYASEMYGKCMARGRELLDTYIEEMKGASFKINPFSVTSPHSLGDGNDDVSIIKKIGVLLPDTTRRDSSGAETHTDTLSASEARQKHRLRSRSFPRSTVTKEGRLLKWTNYVSQWQPRYFKLEKGVLSYFNLSTDTVPRGSMNVQDIQIDVSANTEGEFVLRDVNNEYYVMARNAKERSEWVRALGSAKTIALQMQRVGLGPGMFQSSAESFQMEEEHEESRPLDILVAELELYDELLRKQGEVLAETTDNGELHEDRQRFTEQSVLYRSVSKGLMLLLQESVTAISKEERQVRGDLESERIKRSQIKKQVHNAKDKQKALIKMGVPRPPAKKEDKPAARVEPVPSSEVPE